MKLSNINKVATMAIIESASDTLRGVLICRDDSLTYEACINIDVAIAAMDQAEREIRDTLPEIQVDVLELEEIAITEFVERRKAPRAEVAREYWEGLNRAVYGGGA